MDTLKLTTRQTELVSNMSELAIKILHTMQGDMNYPEMRLFYTNILTNLKVRLDPYEELGLTKVEHPPQTQGEQQK